MKRTVIDYKGIALAFALLPCTGLAFDSGSTGVDGNFNPPVNTEVVLPPSGILNYRSVNIPAGVTVTFKKNATNTPVFMLVEGDVIIAGLIDVSGKNAPSVGSEGDGNLADDGHPGRGGPGGYDGGYGGIAGATPYGGWGLGPGAGKGAIGINVGGDNPPPDLEPSGAGFGTPGTGGGIPNGPTYGSPLLLPLVGGSGGGGGFAVVHRGVGGGGGGGAILIACSGSVTVSGGILAAGGNSYGPSVNFPGTTQRSGRYGGAGSGGGIKIVASRLIVSGRIEAPGGSTDSGIRGGSGRIRFEADTFGPVVATSPTASSGTPNPLFVAGSPALRFSAVAGIPVPPNPTGFADVTLPSTASNPITIALDTYGIPAATTIKISVVPQAGVLIPISVDSPPTIGTAAHAATSVAVNIPFGHNTLQASVTYTIVAAVGDALSRFAEGERVEKVTLTSTLGQGDKAMLHTVAGRQFEVEPALLNLAMLSQ